MRDRPTPNRRAIAIPREILAGVAVAALAAGCDVHDERAVTGRETRWWSTTATGPTASSLMAVPQATPAASPAIEYVEGFEAAGRRAADAGLPMLVVFRADWCPWSGELVQSAVADSRVVELSRRFVCVTVDADRDAITCRQFDVRAFPTVLLLDAGRRERFRATGSSAVNGLAGAMGDVLAAPHRPRRVAAAEAEAAR
jgi:hypothetical protein